MGEALWGVAWTDWLSGDFEIVATDQPFLGALAEARNRNYNEDDPRKKTGSLFGFYIVGRMDKLRAAERRSAERKGGES